MSDSENGFAGWAILELMGHRRLGGRVSEATIAGGAFIRIDIPHPNHAGIFTASQFYSPGAVYALTPTTEEIACAIARGAPQPVSRWELPQLVQHPAPPHHEPPWESHVEQLLDELDDAHDRDDEPDFDAEEDDAGDDTPAIVFAPHQRAEGPRKDRS